MTASVVNEDQNTHKIKQNALLSDDTKQNTEFQGKHASGSLSAVCGQRKDIDQSTVTRTATGVIQASLRQLPSWVQQGQSLDAMMHTACKQRTDAPHVQTKN